MGFGFGGHCLVDQVYEIKLFICFKSNFVPCEKHLKIARFASRLEGMVHPKMNIL